MLYIGIVLAWLIALSLAVYLASTAIKRRLSGRKERKRGQKRAKEFSNHRFDEKRRCWVRNVDQVALIDHSGEDRGIFLTVVSWLLFILWEGYWVLEIREQYIARGRLELPYVFLFFIMVVVPLAWYLFLRRKLRLFRLT
jgi:hypothetical protein